VQYNRNNGEIFLVSSEKEKVDQTVGLAFAIYVIVILGHDHQLKKRIEGR
jgi:hypothetical protein